MASGPTHWGNFARAGRIFPPRGRCSHRPVARAPRGPVPPSAHATTDFYIAYNLARADLELKKTSLATVLFDEMKNSLPEGAQLHVLIGRAFLATDYPQLATREFERAAALDPKYPDVHFYLGLASVLSAQAPDVARGESQSLLAKAETSLQETIRLQPQDSRA